MLVLTAVPCEFRHRLQRRVVQASILRLRSKLCLVRSSGISRSGSGRPPAKRRTSLQTTPRGCRSRTPTSNATPSYTIDSLAITQDFEITDLDVRIDDLPHTVGDLTVGIRGPNGYGTNLVALFGAQHDDGGSGNNFLNTVFDDESPNNDQLNEAPTNAPFTKSFKPVFNSPEWDAFLGFPDAETAPQLENFDGISSAGTWKLIVSDHGNVDVGTLNSWSVLITHPTYSCTPFVLTGVSISGQCLHPPAEDCQ